MRRSTSAQLPSADLSDATIIASTGPEEYERGLIYARQGRVVDLQMVPGGNLLFAEIEGSRGARYATVVEAITDGGDMLWAGECTCPVGDDCKHAAAALLAYRSAREHREERAAPTWERSLGALLERPAERRAGVPIALQFEVAGSEARTTTTAPPRDRVRLRAVIPGKNGGWVRTGASWHDLEYPYRGGELDRAHREALVEFHRAYQSGTSSYYAYRDSAVWLNECGRSVWRLLDELTAAGVALVPATGTPGPVRVTGPALLAMDARRDQHTGGAVLAPVVSVEGAQVDAGRVHALGSPAHGMFVEGAATAGPAPGLVLAPFTERVSPQVSAMLGTTQQLTIPADDLPRFLERYYPGLRQVVAVSSADGSVEFPEIPPPRLALTLSHTATGTMALDWAFAYPTDEGSRREPLHGPADSGSWRDERAERALLAEMPMLTDQLPQLRDPDGRLAFHVELRGMDAVRFHDAVLPGLHEAGVDVEVRGKAPDYRAADDAPVIAVSATDDGEQTDWFDLTVTVSVDGEEVPFRELFVALAQEQTHLVLASGTWFAIDRPEFDQLRRLITEARDLVDADGDGLRISRFQAGLWEELTELGVVAEQSQRWAETVGGLLDLSTVPAVPLPTGLQAQLRPYQEEGYQWLAFLFDHGLGGILADDMGLGKTLQALALLARAKQEGQLTAPVLVVAPTSVVANWTNEAARFTPGLRTVAITKTAAKSGEPLESAIEGADLVITSYALFRIDEDAYRAFPWRGLILDEAQFVKNHQAKSYQCARRLEAPFKLAITGTPLENSLMDLWSLLSIVAPGLFPSPQRFTEHFRRPIERGTDPELLGTLRRRVRPLMLRRTKELVAADLPPKQEQVLEVALNPKHQRIYQTQLQRERRKVLGLVDDLDKNRFAIFRSLTLLRQLALDPVLVDDKHAGVRSSKADVFLEHLSEVVGEGHRALVFSQFTGFLRTIRGRLDDAGIPYVYLDGRTRDRAKRIAEFKDGRAPVFLISLKAGGFGLNLTEADYCFVLDPWWNPAAEAQAVDRAHRIGQDKTVMVYRLVALDTIEEKVMALKARKSDLFSRVVDDDALMAAPLSAADIRGLFA